MDTSKLICVVVCTYNRGHILEECLNSLVNQTLDSRTYDVLVVDNNSTDRTAEIGQSFAQQYDYFRYVQEDQVGLSHARNRGYREASTPWVGYLDDDAKAHTNYLERALWVIENYQFDAFGGRYLPWYKYGKPDWVPAGFGTNGMLLKEIGVLPMGNISGGVSFFKKHLLEEMTGFPTDLGMAGKKMAYGEETLLQTRICQSGYTVGFDPDLNVDHLVNTYKLSPWWILKSWYKRGIYYWRGHNVHNKPKHHWRMAISLIHLTIRRVLTATWKLRKRGYRWQNWLLDAFSEPALDLGRLLGKVNKDT